MPHTRVYEAIGQIKDIRELEAVIGTPSKFKFRHGPVATKCDDCVTQFVHP